MSKRNIDEGSADVLKLTPAHLALLESRDLGTARTRALIVGGEELKTAAARAALAAFPAGAELYNEYGPTEAVVGCVVHRFDAARDQGSSSICISSGLKSMSRRRSGIMAASPSTAARCSSA